MESATSKRPRRLVLVAAALALSAAIFAAIQAPLHAQSERAINVEVQGQNTTPVTPSMIEQNSDRSGTYTQRSKNGTSTYKVDKGVSLAKLLELAGADSVKTVVLTRKDGSHLYAKPGDDIIFFYDSTNGGRLIWFRNQSNSKDVNKPDEQVLPDGDMTVDGHAGKALKVEITADPAKPQVGDKVTFTATAKKGLSGEKFEYAWEFSNGKSDTGDSSTQTMKSRKDFTASVTVTGDQDSVGEASLTVTPSKKASSSGGGGSSGGGSSGGGSSGGGSGGGGSSGGGSSGGGSSGGGYSPGVPSTPPSYNTPATPPNSTTPALPPPSTSPPPSSSGRGPNLDPNAPPSASTDSGLQEVSGVLVSMNVTPKPGSKASGSKAPGASAQQKQSNGNGVDWRLAGGIVLTALLVILGALRERRPIRRLLPHPQ